MTTRSIELSRRLLLQGVASATLVPTAFSVTSCAGVLPTWWRSAGGTFEHGVASGDPLKDGVVLWTRVSGARSDEVEVSWELSEDAEFSRPVGTGRAMARASADFTVKVDVRGLSPGTTYYYRFSLADIVSPVGRTRTLPGPGVSRVRLAAVSCSNFPAGYFHVYEAIAAQEVEAVLHLGDYLYEYASDGYATEDAQKLGRIVEPDGELLTLADYRARHALYRRDVALQTCHASHPFIVVWDDHELANNSFHDGALNHSAYEGDFETRRAAALQAWFEWMPIRPPSQEQDVIYRTFEFGDLAQLVMLDTRHRGRDEQLELADYRLASTEDVVSMNQDASLDTRTMLGSEQKEWLIRQLETSKHKWQVLGQQVLMGRYCLPAKMVDAIDRNGSSNFEAGVDVAYRTLAAQQKASEERSPEEQELLDSFVPFNLDAWDGYGFERDELLDAAQRAGSRLVVVAGDTHNAWASTLRTRSGDVVGAEFGTASVTSPGYERDLGGERAELLEGLMQGLVDDLAWSDFKSRGFVVVELTEEEVRARFEFVSTVKERSYDLLAPRELVLDEDMSLREA